MGQRMYCAKFRTTYVIVSVYVTADGCGWVFFVVPSSFSATVVEFASGLLGRRGMPGALILFCFLRVFSILS